MFGVQYTCVQLFSAWVGRGLIGDWKGSKKKNKGGMAVLKFRDQVDTAYHVTLNPFRDSKIPRRLCHLIQEAEQLVAFLGFPCIDELDDKLHLFDSRYTLSQDLLGC